MGRFKILDWLSKPLSEEDYEVIGVKFSQQTYFKELALFIAISYIANTLSKCEIKTYEGGKEVKNELYYMLNVNPNPNQNSSQFMNNIIENYFYHGDALVVPYRRKALYVADGFSLQEQPLRQNLFTSVTIEGATISRQYKASDVFYFKLDNREVIKLVRGLYEEYGSVLGAAIDHFIATNVEKYKMLLDNYQAGDENFQKTYETVIKKNLKTFLESSKGVYPQFRGTSLERFDTGAAATSADIVAMRKEIFETTAQAFKIPVSMMYGNITNMNEIVKVYLSICIDPIAQMMSEELTRKTCDFGTWSSGNRVVIDTSCINHVDVLDVADKIDKLVASGFATIDDVRKRVGWDALDTDFSTAHFITKNYEPASSALNPMEGGESNATE